MRKNIDRNISKNLNGKQTQKPFDHDKQSTTDEIKTSSKRVIQKIAEATGDQIGNKIANKITGISKKLQQNNSVTVISEYGKEIPKERYVCPRERQKITDGLRLI